MTDTTDSVPDPDQYEWQFEQRGAVGIWFMEGWQGFPDDDLDAAVEWATE
jgi:hypothetical protein